MGTGDSILPARVLFWGQRHTRRKYVTQKATANQQVQKRPYPRIRRKKDVELVITERMLDGWTGRRWVKYALTDESVPIRDLRLYPDASVCLVGRCIQVGASDTQVAKWRRAWEKLFGEPPEIFNDAMSTTFRDVKKQLQKLRAWLMKRTNTRKVPQK